MLFVHTVMLHEDLILCNDYRAKEASFDSWVDKILCKHFIV